jgi:hypothetical protein
MKMLSQYVTQIVITVHYAHDLGNRAFRKSPLRFEPKSEEISQHFNE